MRTAKICPNVKVTRLIAKTAQLGVLGLFIVASLACGSGDGPSDTPAEPVPPPPQVRETYGNVQVTTRTLGTDLDPDGFILQVDGYWDYSHQPVAIGINETVLLRMLTADRHTLRLDHVSPNCTGAHLDSLPIVVAADSAIAVEFRIVCSTRPR